MESSYQKIEFVAELYFRMIDFSNFCLDDYYSSGCKKRKCRYEIFSGDLNKYLSNAEIKEDENKIVFIVHCVNSLDIFYSYYNLAVTYNTYLQNIFISLCDGKSNFSRSY